MTSYTQQQYNDDGVVMKTSVDTLLEGYLSEQSLGRGVRYCHSLVTSHHIPSATLLYQLTSRLISDQLVSLLITLYSIIT